MPAGKEIKTIVQEGMDCITEQQLNVKLADAHGWPVVEAMYNDEVLAASGNEDLDKKLRMAQKQVAAEKEAAAKKKGSAYQPGKGGWQTSWQGGKGGKGK